MAYSRFDDTILLLLDLCHHLDDDEIMCIMDVKNLMVKNEKFSVAYAAAAKNIYIKNFSAIQNQTYQLQRFSDVHTQIMQHIERQSPGIIQLLDAVKLSRSQSTQTLDNMRRKIEQLKKK